MCISNAMTEGQNEDRISSYFIVCKMLWPLPNQSKKEFKVHHNSIQLISRALSHISLD